MKNRHEANLHVQLVLDSVFSLQLATFTAGTRQWFKMKHFLSENPKHDLFNRREQQQRRHSSKDHLHLAWIPF
jgi:hypothetical protein